MILDCMSLLFLLAFATVQVRSLASSSSSLSSLILQDTTVSHAEARKLYTFQSTPNPDPAKICAQFEKQFAASNTTYHCNCTAAADTSITAECSQAEENKTCNSDATFCYLLNLTFDLNVQDVVETIETCTNYVDVNFSKFQGTSTVQANYSHIRPCVKTYPTAPGNFSKLASCDATVNGKACNKCKICGASNITMDCSSPNGKPLQVKCGQAVSGSFAPFFDAASAGVSRLQGVELALLSTLAIAISVSFL